jgi:hypothetical protein
MKKRGKPTLYKFDYERVISGKRLIVRTKKDVKKFAQSIRANCRHMGKSVSVQVFNGVIYVNCF